MEDKIEYIAHKRGYVVSEEGIMYNPKGSPIGNVVDVYESTHIRVNRKPRQLKTHRLQAFQKYGIKLYAPGIVTRHLNSNPLDNSWDNIVIGTPSENFMDIPEQIRIQRAQYATSFTRKYDKETVREFHSLNPSYKKTMEHFGISSKGTLHFILNK